MEDQAVHVVGDVGEGQFRLGPGEANRADEQAEAVLLMGEDVLDPDADVRLDRGRSSHVARRCQYPFQLRLTGLANAPPMSRSAKWPLLSDRRSSSQAARAA